MSTVLTGRDAALRHGRLVALSIGGAEPNPAEPGMLTGISKRQVPSARIAPPGVAKGRSGVAGDFIGATRFHGGDLQAVYAYAAEDYAFWADALGAGIDYGTFGENLTTEGLDPSHALLGERWTIGEVVLEVTGPRVPCSTFEAKMSVAGWVGMFTRENRTGAYFRVLEPGTVDEGAVIAVESPEDHGITVDRLFLALNGDPEAADACLASGVLAPGIEEKLLKRAAGRRG